MCKNLDLQGFGEATDFGSKSFVFVFQIHLANECRNTEYSYYPISVYPAGLINVARGASGDIS